MQSQPYFMNKESKELLTGNDRFEGFVIDVIDEISQMLGFHYIFKVVDDGNYGSINRVTGEWNGMIRELLDGVSSPHQLLHGHCCRFYFGYFFTFFPFALELFYYSSAIKRVNF